MFRQLTQAMSGAAMLSARVMAKAITAPADTALWAHQTTNRKPPQWNSRNKVVLAAPFALLRDFSVGDDDVVPTLLFPPLAGHASCIIDKNGQSQVQLCLRMGLAKLYSFDWLSCTDATKDTTEDDRLDFITRAVDLIAGPEGTVNIRPSAASCPASTTSWGPSRWTRPPTWPSTSRSTGTCTTASTFDQFSDFYDWYLHPVNLPGQLYLWAVEHLFVKNEMFKGELEVAGQTVSLRSITCPVFLLGGEEDDTTPWQQIHNMRYAVGSSLVRWHLAPSGHIGLFIGDPRPARRVEQGMGGV